MSTLPLPLVLADDLPPELRQVLQPGETLRDRSGAARVLPSSFLRVDSWEQARDTLLTPHFSLWELIGVDVREAPLLRSFPRHVPCALVLLAAGLELFRLEGGTPVHVAAHGGEPPAGRAPRRQRP